MSSVSSVDERSDLQRHAVMFASTKVVLACKQCKRALLSTNSYKAALWLAMEAANIQGLKVMMSSVMAILKQDV